MLLPYCEEALTLGFTERHREDLRYCEAFGRWFEWDNGRWREDVRRRVFTHAREHCRERSAAALHDIEDEKAAARVAAVVGLARADVRHATAPEDWDADVWALNTPAGIGDLRTGQDSSARAERAVLALQSFLGRVAGYGLTGSTREHALFFFYGTGANGKGTFLNTLTGIMGDYAQIAGMDTLPRAAATGIPPSSPCCAARGSSRRRRPTRAAAGRKAGSRR